MERLLPHRAGNKRNSKTHRPPSPHLMGSACPLRPYNPLPCSKQTITMKTPKRKYSFPIDSDNYPGMRNAFEGEDVPSAHARQCERWKRKNRVKQLKRTIARILAGENLAPELQTAYRFMRLVLSEERKKADELRFIQGLQMLSNHFSMLAIRHMDSVLNKERKNAHKQAENGQQTELPPTGGQQTTHP